MTHARERRLERFNSTISAGFGIRVLLDGSWGFASSQTIEEKEIERVVGLAIENAEANRMIQTVPILLEDLPAYQEDWVMPMRIDPFTIPADEKASRLLAINDAALQAGADYCSSTLRSGVWARFRISSLLTHKWWGLPPPTRWARAPRWSRRFGESSCGRSFVARGR